ncbi:tumor necrosis factor ligand superfamily member 6-like [Rhinoraja longicauda]
MEDSYRRTQVYTVDGNPNLSQNPRISMPPKVVPRQKKDWQKVCLVVILILSLIILACLTLGTTYLIQLKMEFEKIKQVQNEESSPAKRVGGPKVPEVPKFAAHLTGMHSIRNSKTLLWEATLGNAFTSGIHYREGALIIHEPGYFVIYSKIYFRGTECKSHTLLQQTVFKRTKLFPADFTLMIARNNLNCPERQEAWSRNSFQTGIFKLQKGDHIYVNVSNPMLVHFDQFYTFFGLHKL